MSESAVAQLMPLWLGAASAWTFILFGLDKWQAGRNGGRIAEATLCWCSALGGWPGGLLGMLVFRHKSAKGSFQWKFAAAFLVWAALVAGALKLAGRF
jgi:uncharacterized membrane protein YsdA (DUF1294 family)